jgi:hypothetical protein
MNIARKVAIALVSATLSVGLLGISAPAHADSGWGAGRCGNSCWGGR